MDKLKYLNSISEKQLKKYFFSLFFLISVCGIAQEEDFILGQLVDSTKHESIPFATIKIKDKALGVISNIDGTFKIPLRFKKLGDILEISCMGYISKELSVAYLSEDKGNIIYLQPGAFNLNEAVVSANISKLTAKKIVQIAVNSIPLNYPAEKFEIAGYYRDYQVKNGDYTNLNEAIIKVQDEGFGKKDILNNRYQMYSYNQNLSFEVDSFARQPYDYGGHNKVVPGAKMQNAGGNEFITLRMHDAIRNYGLESFSFVDSIATQFVDRHTFRIARRTNVDREKVYEIDLNYGDDHYLAEGKIYVNTEDFAIHKLDYALFKKSRILKYDKVKNPKERFTDGFTKMRKEMLYRIRIEYGRGHGNQMFLNYISFYNKVLLKRPAVFRSKFFIRLDDKSFRVYLNKMPANPEKIRTKDFKIKYRNQHVPLEHAYFRDDDRSFVLCPHVKYTRAAKTFKYLFTPNRQFEVSDLSYSYGNIKDSSGNKLDERKLEYLHQYREFFVQEISPGMHVKTDSSTYMIKELSLGNSRQPKNEKGIKKQYWKNTPLPVLKKNGQRDFYTPDAFPNRLYTFNRIQEDSYNE